MPTITITGEISHSQDVEVDVDIADVVSEHASELKEELISQGEIQADNEELIEALKDRLEGIQTSIEGIKSDLGNMS